MFQVDIKAYDLGEPQLSSVMSVPVFIRHSATVPPETGLGFGDDLYTVEVPENATVRTLVKTLTIVNSKAHRMSPAPLHCSIVNGNEEGEWCALPNKKSEVREFATDTVWSTTCLGIIPFAHLFRGICAYSRIDCTENSWFGSECVRTFSVEKYGCFNSVGWAGLGCLALARLWVLSHGIPHYFQACSTPTSPRTATARCG